ncbi:MAG: hypothetical protein K0U75_11685 [Actinomycetia bacterium]|nr:hypothetical protein [Actinomycetes bacterium]
MIDVTAPSNGAFELDLVAAELSRLDPTGDRVAAVLRATFDQLYDGQHTGRWNFDELHKMLTVSQDDDHGVLCRR